MIPFIDAWIGLYACPHAETGTSDGRHAGQGLVEYALLLVCIFIPVIISLVFFGDKLNALYSKVGNSATN